jgi:hypothetical protein
MLKEDKGYIPIRYKTTQGNKTALGLYETAKRLLSPDSDDIFLYHKGETICLK